MQRQTTLDNSLTGWVAGGTRGCLHKVDDKPYLQEITVNFSKGEWRDKVEHPQNYGFTSYAVKAVYGDDGQIERCAEHFTQFMLGNRAFPISSVLDDRRYRLRNFKEGESAVYDDQQQKVHVQRERVYTRSQYKVEMRVVKDQPKMEGHGRHEEADRDQQLDKSRRWSTYMMDKDIIVIERTDIVNDPDDPEAKTQDETDENVPAHMSAPPAKHIIMLSRVFLDKLHIHILTPTISILWDEEKKFLKLNTGRNLVILDDINQNIVVSTPLSSMIIDDTKPSIVTNTPLKNIMQTPNLAVFCDEAAGLVRVGDLTAKIPAAMKGSVTAAGDVIVSRLAAKVVVK